MHQRVQRLGKLLASKGFYQPIVAGLAVTGFGLSQTVSASEPGDVYVDDSFDLGGNTKHLCIDFMYGNGVSACGCPCALSDMSFEGESTAPRPEMAMAPIVYKTGGVVENPEDIRVTSNSFSYTHKREYCHANFYLNSIGAHQGEGWTNALLTQLLMEDAGDANRLLLMLDAASVRPFTRRSTDTQSPDYYWFDGPDDSYASIYHNTTDARYEIINNESGELLYFEDLDGTDGGANPDVFFMTSRNNAYGQERLSFNYGDFGAGGAGTDPYLETVKVQRWDSGGSSWVTDRQVDYVYTQVGTDDYLKEIRVWNGSDTVNGHVVQWVRYTYHGEAGLSAHADTGDTGKLIMVENYTAGTGQTPQPDMSNAMNPADFAGNKVTMYRYQGFVSYVGAFSSVYDPDAVERMLASDTFKPTGGETEYDALIDILESADDDGTLSDNDVLYYASRTFEYYSAQLETDNSNSDCFTAFNPSSGTDLNTLYGGEERFESTDHGDWRVKNETVNTGRGGERKDYYYLALNAGGSDPDGYDAVKYLTIEDTVDADGTAVYRTIYGLNKQGIKLREVLIEDPTGTPTYWCNSYLVGTSGRGLNKPVEHRPPSAHTIVDTAAELIKFLNPTGNSGANDTDTLNTSTEGGRVYLTDYTEAAGSYTVTTGVKDLSASTTDVQWLGYQHFVEYGSTNQRFHLDEVYVEPGFGTTTKPTPANTADNDALHYDYTFHDGSSEQVKTRTVTAPVVTTGENGSGVATTTQEYFDESGRKRWVKDGEGNVTYLAPDKVNGQRALVIQDIDTASLPGEVTSATDHWVAWSGAAPFPTGSDSKLNLKTITAYDGKTRPRKLTDPAGVETFVAYQGSTTLVFPGWEAESGTSNKPDLPIVVSRTDDVGRGLETYTLPNTVTITDAGSDDPSNVSGVDSDDYLSWMRYSYNRFGQLEHADRFHSIPSAATTPVEITHFYRDRVFYDAQGRAETTVTHVDGTTAITSATEQVTQLVYDVLDRVTEVKTTVSGTGHSILSSGAINTAGLSFETTRKNFYDQATPGSGASGVGDGLVTAVQTFSDANSTDVYVETRYHRNGRAQLRGVARAGSTTGAETVEGPFVALLPDNLGRTIGSALFEDGDEPAWADPRNTWENRFRTDTTGVTGRRGLTRHAFDLLGQRYHSDTYSVDDSGGAVLGRVETDLYFDRNGQLAAGSSTAGGAVELAYDGAMRPYQERLLAALAATKYSSGAYVYRSPAPKPGIPSGGKIPPGAGGDDKVLAIAHAVFDDVGNILQSIRLEADHDDTTNVGLSLTYSNDYVQTATHFFYDGVHRLDKRAAYGTGTANYTYAALPTWDDTSIPASSDTVLVTDYDYDTASRLLETTDPAGVVYQRGYDDLHRAVYSVANYVDFNFSTEASTGGGSGGDDQVTKRVYNALNQVTQLVALDRDGDGNVTTNDNQTTTYTYGNTYLAHVLARITMPDSTGPSDGVTFTYHLNGQLASRLDQRFVVMTPAYDAVRRLQARKITLLPAGVDGDVRSITYGRDSMGRVNQVTSHGNVTGDPTDTTNIRNQVVYTFHDHHALAKERQDHDSAVDAGGGLSTQEVAYAFDESLTTGVYDHALRPSYATYPNGMQVHTTYGTSGGIDDLLSRAVGLADGSGGTPGSAIATYTWMGAGTLAKKVLNVPGVELDRIAPDGSAPTAGLEGLDRFGRVIAQAWSDTSGGGDRIHTAYGYDRAHRMLYADRLTNPGLSQAYTYDHLHRLSGFAVGVLERDSGGDVELTGTGIDAFASTDPLYTLIEEDHDLDLLHNAVAIDDDATTDKVQQAVNAANELDDTTSGDADRTTDPTKGSNYRGPAFSNATDKDDFEPALDLTAGELTSEVSIASGVLTIADGDASASTPAAMLAAPEVGPMAIDLRVKSSGSTGRAGLIFGYKSDTDYWLYVVDFSLGSNNASLIRVSGVTQTTVYTRTAAVDGNGYHQVYTRGAANALDLYTTATDLSGYGGFPAGRWGLYTEATNAQFNSALMSDDPFVRELTPAWSASSRNVVVDRGSGNGALLTSGAWDRQTLPTLLEGVRGDTFRVTFSTERAATQPYAAAYLVMGYRGSGHYAMVRLMHDNDSTIVGMDIIDGERLSVVGDTPNAIPAATDAQKVWYRVACDGTDVTVYAIQQASEPTTWTSSDIVWQTTASTDRFAFTASGGGQIGFASSTYTLYADNITVEVDRGSGYVTEHVETFDLNTSDQHEENLDYDAAGNLTYDGVFKYTYDAFNRLVKAQKAYRDGSGVVQTGSTVVEYAYDGQHRRTVRHAQNSGELDAEIHYYCAGPRVVEERLGSSGTGSVAKQYVWGLTYIDELIRAGVNHTLAETPTAANNVCERWYDALTDTKHSVLGLVNQHGRFVERYEYTPDGRRQVYSSRPAGLGLYSADADDDGDVDSADYDIMYGNHGTGSGMTIDDGDADGDGDVDDFDILYLLSQATDTLTPSDTELRTPTRGVTAHRDSTSRVALGTVGFQGLMHDEVTGNIYQRAREYNPRLARFMQRDPLGYPDGMNSYAAYHVLYGGVDPWGLKKVSGPLVWLYTGSYTVEEEVYDNAVDGAGDYYLNNAGDTHRSLNRLKTVDPTGLAGAAQQALESLEGQCLHNESMKRGKIGQVPVNSTPGLLYAPGQTQQNPWTTNTIPPIAPPIKGVTPTHAPAQNPGQQTTQFIHDWGPCILVAAMMIQNSESEDGGDNSVEPYEVGPVNELKSRPRGRNHIHHAPQQHPARQVIPGYNPETAPGIVLPAGEHMRMNCTNLRGPYNGTPAELFDKTIEDIEGRTNAPSESIDELIDLINQTYPGMW